MELHERLKAAQQAADGHGDGKVDPFAELKTGLHLAIISELGPQLYNSAATQELLHERVVADDQGAARRGEPGFPATTASGWQTEIQADILGYGPIEPLLADETVSEMMINGPYDIWLERDGLLSKTPYRFNDESHLRRIINKMVGQIGRRIDESSPMVDARLPDGSRVNAIIPPLSLSGPARHDPEVPPQAVPPRRPRSRSARSPTQAADFLKRCVRAELNILISGGTGAGKTTLLNALSEAIPDDERIVTIEDAAELSLKQRHVLRLEARPKNIEGEGEITIRDLVRNSLRMRPDRIIVGEVRGAEALDMLQAMNTGHDGSLSTVHGNSPRDALARVETMVLMAGYELPMRAIRQQVASALEMIVHLERMDDGTRRVTTITEVQRMESDVITLQDLFTFRLDAVTGTAGSSASSLLRPAARASSASSRSTGSNCRPISSGRSRSRRRWRDEEAPAVRLRRRRRRGRARRGRLGRRSAGLRLTPLSSVQFPDRAFVLASTTGAPLLERRNPRHARTAGASASCRSFLRARRRAGRSASCSSSTPATACEGAPIAKAMAAARAFQARSTRRPGARASSPSTASVQVVMRPTTDRKRRRRRAPNQPPLADGHASRTPRRGDRRPPAGRRSLPAPSSLLTDGSDIGSRSSSAQVASQGPGGRCADLRRRPALGAVHAQARFSRSHVTRTARMPKRLRRPGSRRSTARSPSGLRASTSCGIAPTSARAARSRSPSRWTVRPALPPGATRRRYRMSAPPFHRSILDRFVSSPASVALLALLARGVRVVRREHDSQAESKHRAGARRRVRLASRTRRPGPTPRR